MTLVISVILIALIFEFINGFHDTANAIATVVSTKVLTPRQAIVLAALTNLLGAMWGTAVAKTIASGIVDPSVVTSTVLMGALLGAIIWNLITWRVGLPSSSSHALIGGLCGAAVFSSHNPAVIIWSLPSDKHWWEGKGVLWKVIVPMISSPFIGFAIAVTLMTLLYLTLQNGKPRIINSVFGKLQVFSAASMGFMHGTNDAQKTMGMIALSLVTATKAGVFEQLPDYLHFLHLPEPTPGHDLEIDVWIKVLCAVTMALGTAAGGWRIIKTLGHKMVKLQPINGFAAETSSSIVLFTASHFGIPVSTTHNITAAVMGVGAAKKAGSIRWVVVERIVWAWILTLPAAAGFAYGAMWVFSLFGLQ